MNTSKGDYLYIRRWGEMMGSDHSYIGDQIRLAQADRAPQTATFKREGGWHTIEQVTNPGTQYYFQVRGWMTPDWKVPG